MTDASNAKSVTTGPLRGIRVLDMTALVSGPYCSQILADLGAEVLKVETAGSDVVRFATPKHNGLSAYFEQFNRGKKSIDIDVKSEKGRSIVRRLADTSDVFLQNSRPGVMERLGFGYEDLRKSNPRLIYVAISGFGESGPFADRAAYDAVIQGITGFMPVQGGDLGPMAIRSVVADKITAVWAANSTLAALLHRANSAGLGQKISVNMTSAYSAFMLVDNMRDHTFRSAELESVPPSLGSYRSLKTSDGQVIGMVLQPSQCERFLTVLGRPDLVGDPRFAAVMSLAGHMDVLYDAVAEAVSRMTTVAFLALMEENSVPFGKVNNTAEFLASREAKHAEAYVDFEDPEYGTIRHLNYPARFERSPVDVRRRAPTLGEHTEEILASLE